MKNILLKTTLVTAIIASCLTGCEPNISPDVVQETNANAATPTLQGKIVSMQMVTVKGNNTVGTLGGAALGAVAGSAIGGSSRSNIAGGIAGGLLGGYAGNAISDKMTTQQGIQYIVKITHGPARGNLLTIVQGQGTQMYSVGQCVYVVGGSHARIMGGC